MADPVSSIDYWQQRGYEKDCPDCEGVGSRDVWTNSQGSPVVSFPCRRCKGTGIIKIADEGDPT